MMTFDEARAHQGAEVTPTTPPASSKRSPPGTCWVRWRGVAAAQPVHPDELTFAVAAAGPVVAYLVHMDGEDDYCFDPADVTIVRRAAEPADGAG